MGGGYEPERNWGCIIATVLSSPLLLLWLFGSFMSGGGCEGAAQPCTPRHGLTVLGVAVLIGAALALAWLINSIKHWLKTKPE